MSTERHPINHFATVRTLEEKIDWQNRKIESLKAELAAKQRMVEIQQEEEISLTLRAEKAESLLREALEHIGILRRALEKIKRLCCKCDDSNSCPYMTALEALAYPAPGGGVK